MKTNKLIAFLSFILVVSLSGCSPEDDLIISIECRGCGSDCAYKINFQGQTVSGCVDPKDQRWAKELKPDLDYGYAKFVDATKTYDWCA